jgi:signal transduction histidine kinase/DNA-binding response OmpR family regulator
MRMLKEQVLQWFVPAELRDNARAELQAFRAIVFGLAMVFWAPVFAPIYYLLGSIRASWMVALVAAAIFASMLSLRFTKSVWLTGHLIAGSVFAVLIGLATVTGGTGSPSLWWLPAVPIIGLILCGVRSGMAWAALSCLACVAFLVLDRWGVALPEDIGPDDLRVLNWAGMSGIILCAFSLTLAFKLGEDAARVNLENARLESEQANKAKSAFLANMSHEIRTPMNAVIGMTELVLGTDLSRQQREYLNVVRQSSESLLSLLNDILDFSKIEAGKLQLDCRAFDLHECLGDTMKALGVQAYRRGLELICDIRPEVPRAVVGDQGRLRQIVVNLVGNAIKFTEQGEVVLTIRCEARTQQEVCLHFSVADTGIGIPPHKQQVVFGLFEQADASTTRRYGGTGLGLAICSRLVGMMQGRIGVESEEGRGSTFHFTAQFGVASESDLPRLTARPVTIHDTRVLVVDDNATNRRLLDEILRSWGVKPDLAADAHQALGLMHHAHALGEPYRLVVTDAHMPDIDGFMFVGQIRESPEVKSAIVMMLTSGDNPDDLARCEQLKIASYLLKPVKQSELLDEMLRTLGVATTEDSRSERLAVQEAAASPHPALQILLVEDSPVNQKLANAVLQKARHQVTIANHGREALDIWRSQAFDLILMDIQMPEMDGLEATQAIRAQERTRGGHIPIIAMTAHALKGDRERCLEAGMDEYVSKPIHAKNLLETIQAVMGPRLQAIS